MLTIIGTLPDDTFPLSHGLASLDGDNLLVDGLSVPVNRGTPALLGAAIAATQTLNGPEIYTILIGDTGIGHGSRKLYRFLAESPSPFGPHQTPAGLTFHYLQPDVDWHNKVLFAVEALPVRPLLIADAGFMYAAKMSGQARAYDLFTPDAGELAFLADEMAPHPFYTRGFILNQNNNVPDLIRQAWEHDNAADHLLVKGSIDRVARQGNIIETVDSPSEPAMEAIGGTGDTLTGMVSVLCAMGIEPVKAGIAAARANRLAGQMAAPTPATQVMELIKNIPRALQQIKPSTCFSY
ncbi:MAG: NAD(P)H-hydrate dehydratase [Thermodesulfobacteriota bacterium]|nr:NAD(P)H-hydrate dehydratase [Thermodesulfobacteriota bacterium]